MGSTKMYVVVCGLLFPIRFLSGAMFPETSLSEVFGPLGGLLSRDDGVANFEILQSCTERGTDRYVVHNIHCSPSPNYEQVGGQYS